MSRDECSMQRSLVPRRVSRMNATICTEKQARASKYINPLMPYAAMHTVWTLCLFLVPEDETGMCVLMRVSNLCCIWLETRLAA